MVWSCAYESRRRSVVSFQRCLLSVLNQDSALLKATLKFEVLVLAIGLPPNPSDRTPEVPSANSEFTRTDPAGRLRYGEPELLAALIPNDVSLRK
jgi:hypothetical protein